MHLFDEGSEPFLEFLRNLTPQIALLAISFVVGSRLDFTEFDLGNFFPTALCLIFLFLSIAGMVANSINFMVKYCTSLDRVNDAVIRLHSDGATRFNKWRVMYREAKKIKWSLVSQLLIATIAVQAVILAVYLSSLLAGTNFLKALAGGA